MQVLIVDDNAVNLAVFERLVERVSGSRATTFTAPQDALDRCSIAEPEVDFVNLTPLVWIVP